MNDAAVKYCVPENSVFAILKIMQSIIAIEPGGANEGLKRLRKSMYENIIKV